MVTLATFTLWHRKNKKVYLYVYATGSLKYNLFIRTMLKTLKDHKSSDLMRLNRTNCKVHVVSKLPHRVGGDWDR